MVDGRFLEDGSLCHTSRLNPSTPSSLSCRALVYNNTVEDNARAGIFFHRSTDYADAYNNTARRNAEGDFGVYECTGVTIHDNIMEASMRKTNHSIAVTPRCNLENHPIICELNAKSRSYRNIVFCREIGKQGGRYGVRISMGAQECDVYNNVMSDSTRYGVFFYRGSDEAEVRHYTEASVEKEMQQKPLAWT